MSGPCTKLWGPVEAKIGVGGKKEHVPVYVASVNDSCLLGLDYLRKSGACLDFGDMTMSGSGERLPLLEYGKHVEVLASAAVSVHARSET